MQASAAKQLVNRNTDVPCDLSEQRRCDIAPFMKGNGCRPAVGVAELFMRPSLAYLCESKRLEPPDDLLRGENRNVTHNYAATETS